MKSTARHKGTITRRQGNPVFWLQDRIESTPGVPLHVLEHMRRLFHRLPNKQKMDRPTATQVANQLWCRYNIVLVQHQLMDPTLTPSHRWSLTKTATAWLAMEAKLLKAQQPAKQTQPSRKQVPTAPRSVSRDTHDEPDGDEQDKPDET